MSTIAFALNDEYAETFAGAVLALPDGSGYDVGAELEKGDGAIVVDTDNHNVVALLKACDALEEVPVPAAYGERTAEALRDMCRARELPVSGSKDELVARLEAHDNPSPPESGDENAGQAGEED